MLIIELNLKKSIKSIFLQGSNPPSAPSINHSNINEYLERIKSEVTKFHNQSQSLVFYIFNDYFVFNNLVKHNKS